MHVLQSLLSAIILIVSINAAPFELQPSVIGWQGPGVYKITNVASRTSVDLFHGGTEVVGWNTNNTPNQSWRISQFDGKNQWVIQNSGTSGAITSNGFNQNVVAKPLTYDPAQLWTITELGTGGPVNLVNVRYPSDVLDLAFGSSANRTPIVTYSRSDRTNQQWLLQYLGPLIAKDHLSLTINVGL